MAEVLNLRPARVYKIVSAAEWEAARARGAYAGSADDQRDGYIHLSAAGQVDGVLSRYFANARDLLSVAFESATLGAALKWEVNSKGDAFPHLYAPLPTSAALVIERVPDDVEARRMFASALT